MKSLYIFLFYFIIASFSLSAQDFYKRICGNEKANYLFRELSPTYDSDIKQMTEEWLQFQNDATQRTQATLDTTYTIQVVVHIVYLDENPEQNIPDEIIHSQIDALNRDFGVKNADTSNLRTQFIPFRGYPKIKFQLASIDPSGNPTTGIQRVAGKAPSKQPNFTNPFDSVLYSLLSTVGDWFKKGYTEVTLPGNVKDTTIGSPIWNNKQYLNIWVTNLNLFSLPTDGTLGGFAFAPPGLKNWPSGIGYPADEVDGVSIDFRFFGENNVFVQNHPNLVGILDKGRTTVHEVGHYLGLRHTWGDYGNVFGLGCNLLSHELFFTDGIDDTPAEKAPFSQTVDGYNCDTSVNTCNVPYKGRDYPDLFENYMDYSGDACYNMFTKQQADYMRWVLTRKRNGIISNREVEVISKIKTIAKNNIFSVYPNPTNKFINLTLLTQLKEDTKLEITDITGRTVLEFHQINKSNNNTIDISFLERGNYFVKVSNNEFIATEKIIIN